MKFLYKKTQNQNTGDKLAKTFAVHTYTKT